MSGYLQRLVSSARTPGTAIRPVLGSLFSASAHESTAERLPGVEEMINRHQPEFLAKPSQPLRAIRPGTEPSLSAHDIVPLQTPTRDSQAIVDGTAPETLQAEEQILISAQREGPSRISQGRTPFKPQMTSVPQGTDPALKTNGEGGLREKTTESAEPLLERTQQRVVLHAPYRPVVADNLARADVKPFRSLAPLSSEMHKAEKAQRGREADEIQIHIGRIEVTAVPPAPARPAALPVRKSVKLEEYLKRGRSG